MAALTARGHKGGIKSGVNAAQTTGKENQITNAKCQMAFRQRRSLFGGSSFPKLTIRLLPSLCASGVFAMCFFPSHRV